MYAEFNPAASGMALKWWITITVEARNLIHGQCMAQSSLQLLNPKPHGMIGMPDIQHVYMYMYMYVHCSPDTIVIAIHCIYMYMYICIYMYMYHIDQHYNIVIAIACISYTVHVHAHSIHVHVHVRVQVNHTCMAHIRCIWYSLYYMYELCHSLALLGLVAMNT